MGRTRAGESPNTTVFPGDGDMRGSAFSGRGEAEIASKNVVRRFRGLAFLGVCNMA